MPASTAAAADNGAAAVGAVPSTGTGAASVSAAAGARLGSLPSGPFEGGGGGFSGVKWPAARAAAAAPATDQRRCGAAGLGRPPLLAARSGAWTVAAGWKAAAAAISEWRRRRPSAVGVRGVEEGCLAANAAAEAAALADGLGMTRP